ncbi:MAG: hypothetical protein AB9842_07560 [Bacteroidales bacterium]
MFMFRKQFIVGLIFTVVALCQRSFGNEACFMVIENELSCPNEPIKINHYSVAFPLVFSSPAGGTYSGPGVSGNFFYPEMAGNGVHPITYEVILPDGTTGICYFDIIVDFRDIFCSAGPFLNPLETHDWIAKDDSAFMEISLFGLSDSALPGYVEFGAFFDPGSQPFDTFFNPGSLPFDGWWYSMTWPGSIDTGGTCFGATGPLDISRGVDGWSTRLPLGLIPPLEQNTPLYIVAKVVLDNEIIYTVNKTQIEVSPPCSVQLNIPDWFITTAPEFYLTVEPVLANIQKKYCVIGIKQDSFAKGVPGILIPDTSNNCGPAALTSCFRWFAAQGDTGICSSFQDTAIINALRKLSKTPGNDPIYGDDLAEAARKWLKNHGKGYEVRRISYNNTGTNNFGKEDWETMRKELEKGQNVITLYNWEEDGETYGHFMTFNSIVNRIQDNGKYKVDYMDPSSGEIIYGELDPNTGKVSGFKDSNDEIYPPDGAVVTENIIICPVPQPSNPSSIVGDNSEVYSFSATDSILVSMPSPGMYWIHLEITDMDGNACPIDKIAERTEPSAISGNIQYNYSGSAPLSDVVIYLKKDGDTVGQTVSDSLGNYSFSNLLPGNYSLECITGGSWGGGNATDGLEVLKYFVGMDTLSPLQILAADADGSENVNSVDALLILRRFAGLIDQFGVSDWIFDTPELQVVSGSLGTAIIGALCTGDVNGSLY